jgi:hypothetical protein
MSCSSPNTCQAHREVGWRFCSWGFWRANLVHIFSSREIWGKSVNFFACQSGGVAKPRIAPVLTRTRCSCGWVVVVACAEGGRVKGRHDCEEDECNAGQASGEQINHAIIFVLSFRRFCDNELLANIPFTIHAYLSLGVPTLAHPLPCLDS